MTNEPNYYKEFHTGKFYEFLHALFFGMALGIMIGLVLTANSLYSFILGTEVFLIWAISIILDNEPTVFLDEEAIVFGREVIYWHQITKVKEFNLRLYIYYIFDNRKYSTYFDSRSSMFSPSFEYEDLKQNIEAYCDLFGSRSVDKMLG